MGKGAKDVQPRSVHAYHCILIPVNSIDPYCSQYVGQSDVEGVYSVPACSPMR